MKKNILTIIIMAISLINTVLLAILIFTIVPAANKTNNLVSKVATIVNLELENPDGSKNVSIEDTTNYTFTNSVTGSLASNDGTDHYVSVDVMLSENTKNENYSTLSEKVADNESALREIVADVFSQYTKEQVKDQTTKDKIKQEVLTKIQDYFQSDFIINVTFSNLLVE